MLSHGTTLHGGQRIRDAEGNPVTGRPEPMMYYYDGSAIAQGMDAARAAKGGGPIRYAVIGLGTGSLACRAQPGDTRALLRDRSGDDPASRANPDLFTFLTECGPDVPIIIGDARLTLAEAPDGSYDVIVVDAFTSDAIPIHLLTREAMAIYLEKLAPHGIVLIHVSNRHLELASVVAGIAAANGMVTRVSESGDVTENDGDYKFLGTVDGQRAQGRGFRPDREVAILGAAAARSAAVGVDRRLFQHRRRADPAIAAVARCSCDAAACAALARTAAVAAG